MIEEYEIPPRIVQLVHDNTSHHGTAKSALNHYMKHGCLPDWFLEDFYAGLLVVRVGCDTDGSENYHPCLFH